MITIIIYDHLIKLSGKRASIYLREVSLHQQWIDLYPNKVSLGYSTDNYGCEHHYIDRRVLVYILTDIFQSGYDFCVKTCDDSYPPVSKFEPWSPPGNLDYCMALGYIEASRDYICMTSRCIPSYVGAWRASPPII
jgi:hypothetical protein